MARSLGIWTTARIMIEDGAYFKGSIEIDRTALRKTTITTRPRIRAQLRFSSTTTPAHATPTKTSL